MTTNGHVEADNVEFTPKTRAPKRTRAQIKADRLRDATHRLAQARREAEAEVFDEGMTLIEEGMALLQQFPNLKGSASLDDLRAIMSEIRGLQAIHSDGIPVFEQASDVE